MKVIKTTLKEISQYNILLVLNKIRDPIIEKKLQNGTRFFELSKNIFSGIGLKNKSTGKFPYITGEDIDDFGFITINKYVDDSPYLLSENILITGRVGTVGKFAGLTQKAICSDNILCIELKDSKLLTYIKWFMMTNYGIYQINFITKGKDQPVINKTNLSRLKVLVPEEIDTINDKLIWYENKIKYLVKKLKKPEETLQIIFNKFFNVPIKTINNLIKKKKYKRTSYDISKSYDLRISIHSLHPKHDFLSDFFKKFNAQPLSNFLVRPIRRGVNPQYNKNGNIRVIKTINLKNQYIDIEEEQKYVDDIFNKKNRIKAGIQKDDILLSSTGEGRGKIDLYNFEEPALADSHISIIRVRGINKKYLTFYFRTLFGKIQLHRIERQVKGTPEIYPNALNSFIIIVPSNKEQELIVNNVKNEFKTYNQILDNIKESKREIEKILEAAIELID